MAQQTTIMLVDDLDGGEADEQVEFSVDGKAYEIDLSAANGERLRATLAPFISGPRAEPGHSGMGARPGHEGVRTRPHTVERAQRLPRCPLSSFCARPMSAP